MTYATLANLLGTPGWGDSFDLDRGMAIWNKATTSSTAIAVGRIATLVESTGIAAVGAAGDAGPQGVVPNLHPVNVDASPTFQVINGTGAEIYIEAGGTIKPNARLGPTTGGLGIQIVVSDVTATPTETTIEIARDDYLRAPWVYVGHYGEGSGLKTPATQATINQPIRVRHL